MRYDLHDYQREAAAAVLAQLDSALDMSRLSKPQRSSFALSAVTGSGKTVIASAVIEAILRGSTDLDTVARPNTTFLWVTDDPALNRQTRTKMLQASELHPGEVREIDNGYLDPELLPGRVYLLNIQKLGKNSTLAKSGVDLRQHSFWDVIGNTINGGATDLVLILDEAHKGMKRFGDRTTIVRQIINGRPGSNPAVPVVWGISATIERFDQAMEQTPGRARLDNVTVDTAKVQASGLLKDEIGVARPDETGEFTDTMLRAAVRDLVRFQRSWAAYSADQDEPEVLPVLVVQVADKADDAKLSHIVGTIDDEWAHEGEPRLGSDAIVHVFGEHEPFSAAGRQVRWVPPESIQGDTDVRVVLAKTAISTGWDCPRAEVLFSERPAKDSTHIAQIIGRMVRMPLAYRVTTDDSLNAVSCYLPYFARAGLDAIKAELEGAGGEPSPVPVTSAPETFERNNQLDTAVFDAISRTMSVPAPDKSAHPVSRAKRLATLLAGTPGGALVADAGAQLTAALNARLDGLAAEHRQAVTAQVDDLMSTEIRMDTIRPGHGAITPAGSLSITTAHRDLEHDVGRSIASIREGVAADYAKHLHAIALDGDPDADLFEARLHTAALVRTPGVREEIDARCTAWVQHQLTTHAAAIANTTGATRDRFRRVQEQTSQPEALYLELRDNDFAATLDRHQEPLPRYHRHLYADEQGRYPADLNALERQVIVAELDRASTVAWYRNPSRPIPSAVRIAYQRDDDTWASLQVDFVIVSRRDDGRLGVSLIDPHGTFLADSRAKLRALADYAEQFGGEPAEPHPDRTPLVRVEALADIGGTIRALDLLDPAVRTAVRAFDGGDTRGLYASSHGRDYR